MAASALEATPRRFSSQASARCHDSTSAPHSASRSYSPAVIVSGRRPYEAKSELCLRSSFLLRMSIVCIVPSRSSNNATCAYLNPLVQELESTENHGKSTKKGHLVIPKP